ncbi:MAG TPA: response regulator transcription factor [Humibacter sp.]|jgi:DNA-binding NarL/FixJ family response regulator|nr:response regulator transcription factor [Humibacter sp.]
MTGRIDVGIADDHDLFREGLVALLGRDSRLRVVGQASDSHGALELVRARHPLVLLLDVSMPGDPARMTIARVKRMQPDLRVVVLTMHQDVHLQSELLAAGASAYLTKTAPSSDVVAAILHAATTDSPQTPPGAEEGHSDLLSEREYAVLRLIAQAYSNKEIGAELNIAEGTVKRHANNINIKLGATSRIDAVRKATRLGILPSQATLG